MEAQTQGKALMVRFAKKKNGCSLSFSHYEFPLLSAVGRPNCLGTLYLCCSKQQQSKNIKPFEISS
jgi:hypothetical protein